MRHNILLSLTLAASVGAAALFTGCSSEPLLPSKSEEYSREFIKNFGIFDQSHDWNHATQTTVNVTTATPTDIKVCAKFDGKLYSFAEYKNVNGQQTLNVDIPKGTTDLIIRANGKNYAVKAGGEVDLNRSKSVSRGSRTIAEGKRQTGSIEMTFGKTDEYKYFPPRAIRDFLQRVPEEQNNMEHVVPNFYFTSFKDEIVTLYPLYWNTSSSHVLGVFWLDDDGKFNWIDCDDTPEKRMERHVSYDQMQDLYWTRSGELMYTESSKSNDEFMNDGVFDSEAFTAYYSDPSREYSTLGYKNESLPVATSSGALRTKGITVRFNKDGVRFGFYIKVGKSETGEGPLQGENFKTDEHGNLLWHNYGTAMDVKPNYNHVVFSNASRNKEYGNILAQYTPYIYHYGPDWEWRVCSSEQDIPFGDEGLQQWFYPSNPNNLPKYGGVTHGDLSENNINFNQAIYNEEWADGVIGNTHAATQEAQELLKYVQASFLEIPKEESYDGKYRRYFAFEDWKLDKCDLNDLIFVLESSKVKITDENKEEDKIIEDDPDPDPEPWEWIIACEDLGTNDFDFNDVVFSVSGVEADVKTATKTVTVKALAAGGALPVHLLYDGKELKPDGAESSEFHAWFGKSAGTIINAKDLHADGMSVEIQVPANFTMACCEVVKGDGESGNMGGFTVKVEHSDEVAVISAQNPNIESKIGEAPQMICVPATWKWPTENTHIKTVYADFVKWCESGHKTEEGAHWHKNPTGSALWPR